MSTNMNKVMLGSLVVLAVGCSGSGGGGGGKADSSTPATVRESETEPVGLYVANLQPMNMGIAGGFTGRVYGAVILNRDGDKLSASTRVINTAPSVIHSQYIYEGTRCPTLSDDTNADGYIDINEAIAVSGKVLIPLDADISSQLSMAGTFPVSDPWGSYTYNRVTSFARMLKDLLALDTNPNDYFTKLAPGSGLDLVGKVVMIHGTNEKQDIPSTVAGRTHLPVWSSVPVACATFEKQAGTPGVLIADNITIGTAEVGSETIGGSGGGNDGAIDRYHGGHAQETTGGGSGTGPTNDTTTHTGELPGGEGHTHTTTGGATTGGTTGSSGSTTGGTTGGSTTGGSTLPPPDFGSTTGGMR